MAAGHRGDVQAVVVALLDVLVHTRVGHVVVVALLHGPVRIVDGDPLRRRQAQPDLLLGRLAHDTRSQPEGLRAHYAPNASHWQHRMPNEENLQQRLVC